MREFTDLNARETFTFLPLLVSMLALGLYATFLIEFYHLSVKTLLVNGAVASVFALTKRKTTRSTSIKKASSAHSLQRSSIEPFFSPNGPTRAELKFYPTFSMKRGAFGSRFTFARGV